MLTAFDSPEEGRRLRKRRKKENGWRKSPARAESAVRLEERNSLLHHGLQLLLFDEEFRAFVFPLRAFFRQTLGVACLERCSL